MAKITIKLCSSYSLQLNRRGNEKGLGPEHPNTRVSVDDLGLILGHLGEYNEAKAIPRRGLEAFFIITFPVDFFSNFPGEGWREKRKKRIFCWEENKRRDQERQDQKRCD